jgi:hypothetical protein
MVLLLAVFYASAAFGNIVITPESPTSSDTITIVVQQGGGGVKQVTSASITQVGNTFVIQQDIEMFCGPPPPPPSSPGVASQFQVGPLPPGAYTITANINFTSCSVTVPATQTAAFAVTPPLNTPALDGPGLLLLGAALAVSALAVLSLRR